MPWIQLLLIVSSVVEFPAWFSMPAESVAVFASTSMDEMACVAANDVVPCR